jgi:hypothetical protein
MFKKIGDKIECNYITKKCTLKSLTCDITSDNIGDLEGLINEIGFKPYVKIFHISAPSYNAPSIERLHRFHIKHTNGIVIKINNEDKEWYQKK